MKEVIIQLDSLNNLENTGTKYKNLSFNCILIDEKQLGLLVLNEIKFKKLKDEEYAEIFKKNINPERSLVTAIKDN